jgi:hypothetical protein
MHNQQFNLTIEERGRKHRGIKQPLEAPTHVAGKGMFDLGEQITSLTQLRFAIHEEG